MERSKKVCLAMNYGKRDVWQGLASAGKNSSRSDAVQLEAFLPGLMTPAEQLLKVHDSGGVGVAEADPPLQRQPTRSLSGQPIP